MTFKIKPDRLLGLIATNTSYRTEALTYRLSKTPPIREPGRIRLVWILFIHGATASEEVIPFNIRNFVFAAHDLGAEHEGEHDLVAFEQTSVRVEVRWKEKNKNIKKEKIGKGKGRKNGRKNANEKTITCHETKIKQ